jgi:hypothetical protein
MSSTAAAWVQAVGSVAAILVAIYVPWRQRRNASAEREQLETQRLQHLIAALRAEITSAQSAADRWGATINQTLAGLRRAQTQGVTIVNNGPIQPGSLTLTDAILYKEVAGELGRVPPDLVERIVQFYSLTFDMGRIANGASTATRAYEEVLGMLPRFKMNAALLILTLDKFQKSGFRTDVDLHLTADEARRLATETGYPLDDVLKERGLTLSPEGPVPLS